MGTYVPVKRNAFSRSPSLTSGVRSDTAATGWSRSKALLLPALAEVAGVTHSLPVQAAVWVSSVPLEGCFTSISVLDAPPPLRNNASATSTVNKKGHKLAQTTLPHDGFPFIFFRFICPSGCKLHHGTPALAIILMLLHSHVLSSCRRTARI